MKRLKFQTSEFAGIIAGSILAMISLTGCSTKKDALPVPRTYQPGGAIYSIIPKISSITPNSGTYLTVVVISGSGFSEVANNNIVRFDGREVVVKSASATELVVVVPNLAGPCTTRVTVQSGNRLSGSTDFYYYTPISDPLPLIPQAF